MNPNLTETRKRKQHSRLKGSPKALTFELSSQDRLCFSCPLPDCVGTESVRCPIWQERHMLRVLKRRSLVQIAKQNRAEMDNNPAPIRSAAWND